MNEALKNTILLADHDEATQRLVVDAVEKIVYNYIQKNLHTIGVDVVSTQRTNIENIALRAVKQHFVNASGIY